MIASYDSFLSRSKSDSGCKVPATSPGLLPPPWLYNLSKHWGGRGSGSTTRNWSSGRRIISLVKISSKVSVFIVGNLVILIHFFIFKNCRSCFLKWYFLYSLFDFMHWTERFQTDRICPPEMNGFLCVVRLPLADPETSPLTDPSSGGLEAKSGSAVGYSSIPKAIRDSVMSRALMVTLMEEVSGGKSCY